jgi:hypothetical protein
MAPQRVLGKADIDVTFLKQGTYPQHPEKQFNFFSYSQMQTRKKILWWIWWKS